MAGLVFPIDPVNGQLYPDPPVPGVNYYVYDAEATTWRLQSSAGTGTGTVTRIDTCSSLTGGPITTTGTLCLSNTGVTAGTYSYATIAVDSQGRITYAANGLGSPGAWTKSGTVITPTVVGDQVQMSQGTYEVPGLSFVGAPYVGFGSENSSSIYFAVGGRKALNFDTHGVKFIYDGVVPPIWITADSPAFQVSEGFRMESTQGDYTALSMGFHGTDGIGNATTYLSLSRPVFGYNTNSLSFYASNSVGNAGALPDFVVSRDGNINTLSRGALRFYDTNNSNYVALRSPDVVGTNVTWSLPSTVGDPGQLLASAGNGSLYWYTVEGTGTVTSIATGTGLSGGPITTSGTISLNKATNFTLGGVRPDGDTIVVDSNGVISAPGAQNWVKVGTTLAPSVADDLVKVYSGTTATPGLSFIGTPGTGFGTDGGQTLFFATSGYKSAELNAQGLRLLSPTGSGVPLQIFGADTILSAQVSSGSNDLNIGFSGSDGLGNSTTYFSSASRSLSLTIGSSPALVVSLLGDTNILSQRSLRLYDTDNSNYVAFRSPAVVGTNVTWTLPATDGASGQALTTNGSGLLGWTTVAGLGTVTSIATGTGLTGGPITTSGTISIVAATNSVLGGVKPDGTSITILPDGTISAPGAQNWTRTGTVLSPTVTGDQVQLSPGTTSAPGLAFTNNAGSGFGSDGGQGVFFAANNFRSVGFNYPGLSLWNPPSGGGSPLSIYGYSPSAPLQTGIRMQNHTGNYAALEIGYRNSGFLGEGTTVWNTSIPVFGTDLRSISLSINDNPVLVVTTDGNTNITGQGSLRFYNANNTNYSALRSPDIGGNVTWTLPVSDGASGQLLTTDGDGALGWVTADGSGTVTSINTGTGLTGGPITTTGTISIAAATTSALGGVKPDGTSIVIQEDGTISAPGAQNWTRTGTVLSPTVSGDQVQVSLGTVAAPGLSFVGNPGLGFGIDSYYGFFYAQDNYMPLTLSSSGATFYKTGASSVYPPVRITAYPGQEVTEGLRIQRISSGDIASMSLGFRTNGAFGEYTSYLSLGTQGFDTRSLSFYGSQSATLNPGSTPDLVIATDGSVRLPTQRPLRFYDGDNTNFVGFQPPEVIGSNVTWTLPAADGTVGQLLSTNGSGVLGWTTVSGTGTVTSVATGTGLTGGPITTSGTISIAPATTSVLGGVKPDGVSITILPDGTISASGASYWTRTGTVLTPATVGDQLQVSPGTTAAPGLSFVGAPTIGFRLDTLNNQDVWFTANNQDRISLSAGGISVRSAGNTALTLAGTTYGPRLGPQAFIMKPWKDDSEYFNIGFGDSLVTPSSTGKAVILSTYNVDYPNNSIAFQTVGFGSSGSPQFMIDADGTCKLPQQTPLRFYDSDSSNYVAFRSPAVVGTNVTWTLPAADGTSGQLLTTDGSGTLSWVTSSSATQNWTRTGTVLSPTVSGDQVQVSPGSLSTPGLALVGNPSTGFASLLGGVDNLSFVTNNREYLRFSPAGLVVKSVNFSAALTVAGDGSSPLSAQAVVIQPMFGDNEYFNLGFATNPAPFGEGTAIISTTGSPSGPTRSISFNANGSAGSGFPDLVIGTDGNTRLPQGKALRFYDADSSNYVGFRSAAEVSTNVTWTLPAVDGGAGQVLSTNGSGILSWIAAGGTGTVTSLNIGTGLTGGPLITTTGTIGLATATTSSLGGVKPDGTSITILPDGTISASGAQYWTRTGTVLSPATAGDQVQVSVGTTTAPGLSFVGASGLGFGSSGTATAFFASDNRNVAYFNSDGIIIDQGAVGTIPLRVRGNNTGLTSDTKTMVRITTDSNNYGNLTSGFYYQSGLVGATAYWAFDKQSLAFFVSNSPSPSTNKPDFIIDWYGNCKITQQHSLQFYDADSTNYVAFRAPAVVGTDVTWTLPAADGTTGQILTTNGSGTLSWATVSGTGTVTSISTGTGLTGGPITTSGTISVAPATVSTLGGVKPDGTTITILSDGTISAPGTQNWVRTGTVLSPTVSGDQVQVSGGSVSAPGLAFTGSPGVGFGCPSDVNGVFFTTGSRQVIDFNAYGLRVKADSGLPNLWIGGKDGSTTLGPQVIALQPTWNGGQYFNLGFETNPAPFGEETAIIHTYSSYAGARSISLRVGGAGTSGLPDLVIGTDGNTRIPQRKALRFYDTDSSNYVGFSAPATVTSNVTWSLPPADGGSGDILVTNGSGSLSWATSAGVTQNWSKTGTVLSPTVAGDQVQVSGGSYTTPGLAVVGNSGVGFGSLSPGSNDMFFAVNGTEYLNFSGGGLSVKSGNTQALKIGGRDSSLGSAALSIQPVLGGNQFFNAGFSTNPAPFGEATAALSTYATGSGVRQSISFSANGTFGSGGFPDLIIGTDGNTRIPQRKAMRFYDADSSNYVGFSAPATVTANTTWSLPPADGGAGQVLTTDGAGNTSWTTKTTGASGTFVSQDGKTVTVTNGLITSIV